MKWVYLEKRSTTVRITDLPATFGRHSMKSMEMFAHPWEGTSSGCRRPTSWRVLVLLCWHVVHV
jgi:hypothetical protein